MEIQQHSASELGNPASDLSENGYQQFDLVDTFDIFDNPHGLDELNDDDKKQLKILYGVRLYIFNSYLEQET